MKVSWLIPILLLVTVFIFNSCDSPTDSKAVQVTPPSPVYPPNNDTLTTLTPTCTWNGTADKIQISEYPSYATLVHEANVSGNSYPIPSRVLENNSTYYWHVGVASGSNIYWSDVSFRFTIR